MFWIRPAPLWGMGQAVVPIDIVVRAGAGSLFQQMFTFCSRSWYAMRCALSIEVDVAL